MIVLDENVLGLRLNEAIAAWYSGRGRSITELRPGTLIKDEAIPRLLQHTKGATFVTTNVPDFWRRVPAQTRYSVVCVALPNERLRQLPDLLRRLFRVPALRTRAGRMGKVIRVSGRQMQYYTMADDRIRILAWFD